MPGTRQGVDGRDHDSCMPTTVSRVAAVCSEICVAGCGGGCGRNTKMVSKMYLPCVHGCA